MSFVHHVRSFLSSSLISPSSSVLVACSGGPDSVALALVLSKLQPSLKNSFHLGHVNHRLRGPQSEKDAAFVKKLAAALDWPCHVMVKSMACHRQGNLEAMARVKRYDALNAMAVKAGCRMILTAHTLDDQVETIFMNLLRGTGPEGLAGMPPCRSFETLDVPIGRPMLAVNKREVLEFLEKEKRSFRQDRSNASDVFLRNWLRHQVTPLLEKRVPGFKDRIATLAAIMRDETDYWQALLSGVEKKILRRYRGGWLLDFKGLLSYPPAVQKRFFRRVIGPQILTFERVESLLRWMKSPPSGGRLWQCRKGWIVERLSKSQGSSSAKNFWLRPPR
jgi:tRNA(Ile)-lysidine synthase